MLAWQVNVGQLFDPLRTNSASKLRLQSKKTTPVWMLTHYFLIEAQEMSMECLTVCGVVGSVSMLRKME